MSTVIQLTHKTSYYYKKPVTLSPQVVRLRPAPHCRSKVNSYSLAVEPAGHFINWLQDPFGNFQARLVFPEKTDQMEITVKLEVNIEALNPFDYFLEEDSRTWPFTYEPALKAQLLPYLSDDKQGRLFDDYYKDVTRSLVKKGMDINDLIVALNRRVSSDVGYNIRLEPGIQSAVETLKLGTGSCRDSSWLLIAVFRRLGIAARFASGYLAQLKPDRKDETEQEMSEDFFDLHAWVEVYLPGAGWIGLDPTSGLLAGEGHIPLACTPMPADAAPVTGFADEAAESFDVTMNITRLSELPRVTRPYDDETGRQIQSVRRQLDRLHDEAQTGLTMGGEPTFVSSAERNNDEWNLAATGGNKKDYAFKLAKKLADSRCPGALITDSQGKWYPGEALPRWSVDIYWLEEGRLWNDHNLLAGGTAAAVRPASTEDAAAFTRALTAELVPGGHYYPLYEDPVYYSWKEGELQALNESQAPQAGPSRKKRIRSRKRASEKESTGKKNTVETARAEKETALNKDDQSLIDHVPDRDLEYNRLEARRIRSVLERGLDQPIGFSLPLDYNSYDGFVNSAWQMSRDQVFLVPGDSPAGLRLPLGSLGSMSGYTPMPDPFDNRPLVQLKDHEPLPSTGSPVNTVYKSLCIEARAGFLYVFIPPLEYFEGWLALIRKVEKVSKSLNLPVVIEGYPPPSAAGLKSMKLTPDPGVLEVNIDPSENLQQIDERYAQLFELARECGLTAQKFLHDGRPCGTRGGNHITLGGKRPSDSPFFKRPDLLRSFLSYWQNHPALSFIFSGIFVGPTSQAPRLDEGHGDALYELELAFKSLDRYEHPAAWIVDRAYRNLLIDGTGNTHRSEFCIDKMFAGHSYSQRLGILELRSFEMPPHHEMVVVQYMLVNALFYRFFKSPYRENLVRWGTALHDRFYLPVFLQHDIDMVIEDLNHFGLAFKREFFTPFMMQRFPVYGSTVINNVNIELRMAVEPWNVLGEESTAGGTVRPVDSANERLQVLVTGFDSERYILACNGTALPLVPTGEAGSFTCGVRFKAWDPVYTLHPYIAADKVLSFDLYDRITSVYRGSCQYHVGHPGGMSFDNEPVNALESASRIRARFTTHGPAFADGSAPRPAVMSAEFPCTLDTRLQ